MERSDNVAENCRVFLSAWSHYRYGSDICNQPLADALDMLTGDCPETFDGVEAMVEAAAEIVHAAYMGRDIGIHGENPLLIVLKLLYYIKHGCGVLEDQHVFSTEPVLNVGAAADAMCASE